MQIPKNLPQFEKKPALFVASGEYEAKFYLALNGLLELKNAIKMPPREEAREKQGFITSSEAPAGFGAVGHHGRYVEDLKKKFARHIHSAIHDLLAQYKPQEIHFFAPRYVFDRAVEKLDKAERKKVKLVVNKEYTKTSPLEMLKILQKMEANLVTPKMPPKKEAQKILKKIKQ